MVEINIDKTLVSSDGEFNLTLNLDINSGEFVTIYGPSGAGKTTFLRLLAGLDKPNQGKIEFDSQLWLDTKQKIFLKANHRSVGLVFQDYALFPNMSVKDNIKYGLKPNTDKAYVTDVIELMDINNLLDRKPNTLSGGQSQRVALARTLVSQPDLLLLDEPLSALDPEMRQRLQNYLRQAHERYQLTTIMVSHDVGEIFKLSDRVIILENGKLKQLGRPADLFFNKGATGRFQFTGEILDISHEDVVYVITVLIGQQVVKVIAEENTAAQLEVGNKVLVTSKAFNPIIQKAVQ
jgi:molybdate transport system ATP-binding protein